MVIGGVFIKILLTSRRLAKTVVQAYSYHIGGDLYLTQEYHIYRINCKFQAIKKPHVRFAYLSLRM